MNVESDAVTQYMNYTFAGMCEFQGVPLGVNSEGLFRLDADLDGSAPIVWDFTLLTTNYGSPNMKRFRNLLIGLAADDDIVVKVNDETYNVRMPNKQFTFKVVKVPCRRNNTKTQYVSVSVGSVTGCKMALDSIDGTLVVLSTKPRR